MVRDGGGWCTTVDASCLATQAARGITMQDSNFIPFGLRFCIEETFHDDDCQVSMGAIPADYGIMAC